ncbi:type III secretion system export apparatus subunit SctR [Cupriavidus plantarum]|uniref:Type III secretion protein R n=1 Tax=Cupriavidus plantarum TaxID=942865 RepID=A0A316ETE4_9BURK|nr:type III secretion system export apparatus subunit SctR [Cupriavidus plantarum]NYI00485.1 type III secretion protein R [Cupriavidus plantarum]PWK34895.1 type III secretion protein R [Cupriavidus plantarum]RLK38768.1 type III secretion protein R [Cupriavidus plantarum]
MGTNINVASLLITLLALGLLPFIAMVVTSYTKIVIVLGLLRNALGAQQVPPSMVTNGIALIVSCFVMAPVGQAAYDAAQRMSNGSLADNGNAAVLFDAAREPFRQFLTKHTSERDRAFFMKSAKEIWPPEMADKLRQDDLLVLAPSFTVSELAAAFRIGFLLYLVFIVIDLVIANILMALGLSQVTPTNVAIPFKLLLFVAMDGWSVLIHGLISTYK